MVKKIIFILLSVFTENSLPGQTDACNLTVKGEVLDSVSGEGLPSSTISWGNGQNTQTDEHGHFELNRICRDLQTELHVSHLDCEHRHFIIRISRDTQLILHLPHSRQEMSHVEVQASARTQFSVRMLAAETAEVLAGKSFSDQLSGLPGISITRTGPTISRPVLQGMTGYRVLILNNGLRQEGQQWGSDHAPEIDPFSSGGLALLKGEAALRYGPDAIGGVISAEPAVLPGHLYDLRTGVYTGFSSQGRTFGTSMYAEGNHGVRWRVQGSAGRGGDLSAPGYFLKNTGLSEQAASGQLRWNRRQFGVHYYGSYFHLHNGVFSGSHLGNLTDLMNAIGRPEPDNRGTFSYSIGKPSQTAEHHLQKLELSWMPSLHTRLVFTGGWQQNKRSEFDLHRASLTGTPAVSFNLRTFSTELCLEQQAGQWGRFRVALSSLEQLNTYQGQFYIPNFRQRWFGLFGSWVMQRGNWRTEMALRSDRRMYSTAYPQYQSVGYGKFDFSGFTALSALRYRWNRSHSSGMSLSSSWRPPAVNELYANGVHHGAATFEKGNLSLRPERSVKLELYHWLSWKRSQWYGEIYLSRIYRFINLIPSATPVLTIRGAFPAFEFASREALIAGFHINGTQQITDQFSVAFTGDFIVPTQVSSGKWLDRMPPMTMNVELNYLLSGVKVSAGWMHTFRQWYYNSGSDYLPPPAGFGLLQLRISGKFGRGRSQGTWVLFSENLLNTRYRSYLNTFRYFTDETGRNIGFKLFLNINY